jgi:hypothetical protein
VLAPVPGMEPTPGNRLRLPPLTTLTETGCYPACPRTPLRPRVPPRQTSRLVGFVGFNPCCGGIVSGTRTGDYSYMKKTSQAGQGPEAAAGVVLSPE